MNTALAAEQRQRVAALALLIATLAGCYWLVQGVWVAKYRYYQAAFEQHQDRLLKLNEMLNTRESLETRLQQIQQDSSVDIYYLKDSSTPLAASRFQQQIKSIVEGSGGSLVSTQILPVAQEGIFSRVAIKVQMTGDTEVLQKVFYALETNRPLLFIEDLQIRSRTIRQRSRTNPRQIETQVQLTAQFDLAGYMRGGAG